jgi:hypothetical protein
MSPIVCRVIKLGTPVWNLCLSTFGCMVFMHGSTVTSVIDSSWNPDALNSEQDGLVREHFERCSDSFKRNQ